MSLVILYNCVRHMCIISLFLIFSLLSSVYFVVVVSVYIFHFCYSFPVVLYVFFFQAEDGIRDRDVTGVQTCALPISWPDARKPFSSSSTVTSPNASRPPVTALTWNSFRRASCPVAALIALKKASTGPSQIGRASCRERV